MEIFPLLFSNYKLLSCLVACNIETNTVSSSTTPTPSATLTPSATQTPSATLAPSITTYPTTTLATPFPTDTTSEPVTLAFGSGTGVEFKQGELDTDLRSLFAGGSTEIRLSVVNAADNSAYNENVEVSFLSTCSAQNTAEFSAHVQINNIISVNYSATGCTPSDTVYALVNGMDVASVDLTIAPPEYGSMKSQISSTVLALKGYERSELSEMVEVNFFILDKQNNPIPNKEVRFSLTNTIGETELTKATDKTDLNGMATTFIKSGTVAGIVAVLGEIDVTDRYGNFVSRLSKKSDIITISTGLADSFGISIAADNFNVHGHNRIGTEINFTAIANDIHNNPVPEGTVINWVASSGTIASTCETNEMGFCSVKWISSNPKNNEHRVHVLARMEGMYSFNDVNGNSRFDDGETFTAFAEPWLDALENDNFEVNGDVDDGSEPINLTPEDFFFDSNNDGVWQSSEDNKDTMYRGAGCSQTAIDQGHCADYADVFANQYIVSSTNVINIEIEEHYNTSSNTTPWTPGSYIVNFSMADAFSGVIPPNSTILSANCNHLDIELSQDKIPNIPIFDKYGMNAKITVPKYELSYGDTESVYKDICTIHAEVSGLINSNSFEVYYLAKGE